MASRNCSPSRTAIARARRGGPACSGISSAAQDLTGGKGITIYAQSEVLKDLNNARVASGGQVLFEVEDVTVPDLARQKPRIRYRKDDREWELSCDFIAGCDGFHGISRPSIPVGVLAEYGREYPFGWLGI